MERKIARVPESVATAREVTNAPSRVWTRRKTGGSDAPSPRVLREPLLWLERVEDRSSLVEAALPALVLLIANLRPLRALLITSIYPPNNAFEHRNRKLET